MERLRREELRKQQTTFAVVAEDYIALRVKAQRRVVETEREIRKELIAPWGSRPITAIARSDVVALVDAITRRPAPYTAHIVFMGCAGPPGLDARLGAFPESEIASRTMAASLETGTHALESGF